MNVIEGVFYEKVLTPGTTVNQLILPLMDVSQFKSFSLQLTGTWSATVQVQVSNDGLNPLNETVLSLNTPTGGASNISANGLYWGPIVARYMQIQITVYTSGTVNGIIELYSTAIPANSVLLASGSAAIGSVTVNNTSASPVVNANDLYTNTHINTNTTTIVKSGAGHLHTISVNTIGTGETITVYDNTAGSGTIIALITPDFVASNIYDIVFNTGLTIVTAGTTPGSYSVSWR